MIIHEEQEETVEVEPVRDNLDLLLFSENTAYLFLCAALLVFFAGIAEGARSVESDRSRRKMSFVVYFKRGASLNLDYFDTLALFPSPSPFRIPFPRGQFWPG